ncbi:hypothetical protein QFZ28_004376 [Neobacillus niacini]|uniref:hypothetical protein n=1 Tax=Neobacillus niacini TaxID=86668 RepID=UPI00278A7E61|nr:hypothetical protein [Neobacillus niacini]MDQ1003976.1 hypothetical protein [Neobacillus niacini]
MTYSNKIKSILGVDVRARYLNEDDLIHDPFKYPIIHKQINGKVIVPLDLVRLWQK